MPAAMFDSLQLVQPGTVAEACSALVEYGEGARIYAGGAELLLLVRQGMLDAEILIDIKKIPRISGVIRENGSLRIGAAMTHSALANDARCESTLRRLLTRNRRWLIFGCGTREL